MRYLLTYWEITQIATHLHIVANAINQNCCRRIWEYLTVVALIWHSDYPRYALPMQMYVHRYVRTFIHAYIHMDVCISNICRDNMLYALAVASSSRQSCALTTFPVRISTFAYV